MEKQDSKKSFTNLIINIILPTIILMKLSKQDLLGQKNALILALALPFIYGTVEYIKERKHNLFSILGLVSIALTGSIGLFQLSREWMIVKETAIPLIIGLVLIIAEKLDRSIIKILFLQIFQYDNINERFKSLNLDNQFEKLVKKSSYYVGSTFFVSAFLNYALAEYILVGEPGSEEFVASLGKMTGLSFPVITLPSMILLSTIFFILIAKIKKTTGLKLEEIINQ